MHPQDQTVDPEGLPPTLMADPEEGLGPDRDPKDEERSELPLAEAQGPPPPCEARPTAAESAAAGGGSTPVRVQVR